MSPSTSRHSHMTMTRHPRRFHREPISEDSFSDESPSLSPSPTPSRGGKKKEERMGGLALPDVVRELLKDATVLRWDARDSVYEVVHGDNFEKRFNELRKVRNKVKASGTERPFSRMYNFFVLEQGDKWARTGTRFRPRNTAGYPSQEFLAQLQTTIETPKKSPPANAAPKSRTANSTNWSARTSLVKPTPIPAAASSVRISSAPSACSRPFSQRSSVTSALAKSMKPQLKSRRLATGEHLGTAYVAVPSSRELERGLEVGAIAQTLLGKRGRPEYMLGSNEPILPAEMIEVTARRLRVLDREDMDCGDYFPGHRSEPIMERHGACFHALIPAPAEHEDDGDHDEEHAQREEEEEDDQAEHSIPDEEPTREHVVYSAGAAMPPPHSAAAFDYDDPSDGFSSGQPSPESVMSLVADFPGSPLQLDEEPAEDYFASVCGPAQHSLAPKEGFGFDTLEESAWMSDSFAMW
mmetsp:Transcript_41829/g.84124  ORF Transcript_41829/g.84124 Transcript_41829/m.84124 type:complete len:467 (+) Transcript_41829:170-1570(+)